MRREPNINHKAFPRRDHSDKQVFNNSQGIYVTGFKSMSGCSFLALVGLGIQLNMFGSLKDSEGFFKKIKGQDNKSRASR